MDLGSFVVVLDESESHQSKEGVIMIQPTTFDILVYILDIAIHINSFEKLLKGYHWFSERVFKSSFREIPVIFFSSC